MLLTLRILPEELAVCRLEPGAEVPDWAVGGGFSSVTRTAEELSVVCATTHVPDDVPAERGWRALKVDGPLDFSLTGVLAQIAVPLAVGKISIFAISTFDTDYVLVEESKLREVELLLSEEGHTIE